MDVLTAREARETCVLLVEGFLYVLSSDVPAALVYLLLAWTYKCIRMDGPERFSTLSIHLRVQAHGRLVVVAAAPWGSKCTGSAAPENRYTCPYSVRQ